MENAYWLRQTPGQPLFPDMLWSRPENRNTAGKLLIVGGNLHGFAAPATAFSTAEAAGVGTVRVLLPDSIKRLVDGIFEHGEFAPSTPSGSFSQAALADTLEQAEWAEATLFAGDLGRNSETAILIERFLAKSSGRITLTKDAADYALKLPELVLRRPSTMLVITMEQLQKLVITAGSAKPVTLNMDLLQLVNILHKLTKDCPIMIITKHLSQLICALDGRVSTTKLSNDIPTWRVQTAAFATVWWLQNPTKPFEALSTSVYTLKA